MPFIPTPNGVKVCMRFTKAGQQVCNVFHVRATDPSDLGTLETIGSVFAAWWNDTLKPISSNQLTLQAVEVTDIATSGAPGIEYTDGLPTSGGLSGTPLPNNVALAIKLTSGLTGRSYRGRSFFPGLTQNNLSSDQQSINSTLQGALVSAFDALLASLVTEGLNLAIASFFSGGAPRTTGVLTDVTGVSVNQTIDSQRRRLPERGA